MREIRKAGPTLPAFDDMIGASAPMQAVYRSIRQVAEVDMPVLILGESGTGKELVAHSIHRRSPRAQGPFVPVHTGAIPIRRELCGHMKGAFAGAHGTRKGRFEQAQGGTLFLDEISAMGEETQAALLRVLETQQIQRVGGERLRRVDIRLICASNENLVGDLEAGTLGLREDLFDRLNVFVIRLPALRERVADIPLLVEAFIGAYAERLGAKVGAITSEALEALKRYGWPGNVRELKNVIQQAVLLSSGGHP